MRPTIIIAEPAGQLGNRLFLFGHFVAFAAEFGVGVANVAFAEHADDFVVGRRDLFCRFPPRKSLIPPTPAARGVLSAGSARLVAALALKYRMRLPMTDVVRLDWRTNEVFPLDEAFAKRVRLSRVTAVQGWLFRNDELFAQHADVVRAFLRPTEKVETAAAAAAARARSSPDDVLVGVHVRHRDYREWRGGAYYFEACDYADLMRRLLTALAPRKVSFLVCSDETQDLAPYAGLAVTFSRAAATVDLHTLARCDLVVGPPSSFSMWASFAGRVPLYIVEDPRADVREESFQVLSSDAWFRQ